MMGFCMQLLEDSSRISLAFHPQWWECDYRMGCAFSAAGKEPQPERGWENRERLHSPGAQTLQEVGQDTLKLRK